MKMKSFVNFIITFGLLLSLTTIHAQGDESDCVAWGILEDNQVVQYDLLTGERIRSPDMDLNANSFSLDGRYLESHAFDDGTDSYFRTDLESGFTLQIDVVRGTDEFLMGSIDLNTNLSIIQHNTPLSYNDQLSVMTSRRLLNWRSQESSYFPYYAGQIGLSIETGHIGIQWEFDNSLLHDEQVEYEQFAWYSFEAKTLAFSSDDNLSNGTHIDLTIPVEIPENSSWDWSDNYGFVWYDEFREAYESFEWRIGESQFLPLMLDGSGSWGATRISPDGNHLLIESEGQIRVYELASREAIFQTNIADYRMRGRKSRWVDKGQILFITRENLQSVFHIVQIDTGEERQFFEEALVHNVSVLDTNDCN